MADAAGFSTGAVYSTFRGKAELFLAVFDARVTERARRLARVGATEPAPPRQGADLAREFAGTSANERDWALLVIEFWVHAARDPELRRQFAERHDALKAAVGRVFDEMLARTGERLGSTPTRWPWRRSRWPMASPWSGWRILTAARTSSSRRSVG